MAQIKDFKRNGKLLSYKIFIARDGGTESFSFSASVIDRHEAESYRRLIDQMEKERKTVGKIYEGTLDKVKRFPLLYRRLVDRRYLDAPKAEFWTLQQLIREFIEAGHTAGKASTTLRNQSTSLEKLINHCGDITLDQLDAATARGFVNVLDNKVNLGTIMEATRAGYIRDVKAAFNWAIAQGIVAVNPFAKFKKGSFRNAARQKYIDKSQAIEVLEACRNSDHPLEWRALFALARFQGLRVPCETRALRWQDVDFTNRLITITSVKTKRYEGKDKRVMPIFAPTLAILQELRSQRPTQVFVFDALLPQMRANANLRTGFLRILRRAGLEPWSKLFVNLRASASTDVEKKYNPKCESRWIGHSEKVADEHYLQVLPEELRDEAGLFSDVPV